MEINMLKNINAVIFDLDGTLVDSMWMWEAIDVEYLSRFGIDLPEGLQREIEGMSFSETAIFFKERFQLEPSVEEIKDAWNEMAYEKYSKEVPLKQGTLKFLQYLKENNIKMGIATSNSKELASAVLKELNVEQYFDAIHTSCEVAKGKPSPDIYLFVAEKLSVKPENCLVFEDIPQGILAGKNAGMKVCAVWDEFSIPIEEEKKRLADYFIMSFDEII
ncbi:HAD family phosphatase [Lachnoclostridium sp.]|uniref:HAD family hydrolase n=1 Tax=Lachnoclostridium sp. TaxID=2028282 RepID=UPI0028A114F7|nr:HAD family phosphatase [Lachnoclostridium sp.]